MQQIEARLLRGREFRIYPERLASPMENVTEQLSQTVRSDSFAAIL
ncbi:MAG: hypothetical protein J6C96_08480 [Oscillospiraceae bacterium]|nr:hypothetical protein [Oscillospiraceae bacterium]